MVGSAWEKDSPDALFPQAASLHCCNSSLSHMSTIHTIPVAWILAPTFSFSVELQSVLYSIQQKQSRSEMVLCGGSARVVS